jgi:hypothetical protein
MSERSRSGTWLQSVARSRGIEIDDDRADELAREAAPTLERFDALVVELCVDDDVYEFRRRLAAEAEQ